jgi:D-arabinose 1-dehydrogenase-like Zn-dependent alcohol dehydrogenase
LETQVAKKEKEMEAMATLPETMKGAVLMGPNQLEIKEVSTPEPGPMEVLLRVDSAACCSTDVALMNNPRRNRSGLRGDSG